MIEFKNNEKENKFFIRAFNDIMNKKTLLK